MTFDYTSMGFYTMDALCRPVTKIPDGGNTIFVDDFAIAALVLPAPLLSLQPNTVSQFRRLVVLVRI